MQKLNTQELGDLPKETRKGGQANKPFPSISCSELMLPGSYKNSLTCALPSLEGANPE